MADKLDIVQTSGGVNIGASIEEAYENLSAGRDVVQSDIAGGVDLEASTITIGGDFVGRDKIVTTTYQIVAASLTDAPVSGLGVWIWQLEHCEGGNPQKIVDRAVASGVGHVVLKVADGVKSQVLGNLQSIYEQLVTLLRESEIQVWGWQYFKGADVLAEAKLAREIIAMLNLTGYIVEVGAEFKKIDVTTVKQLFDALRQDNAAMRLGLSTYHYPTYHRDMPWEALLEGVNFVMPQVYWELSHNPGSQLLRSFGEYSHQTPARPFFPVGSAFELKDWQPTASDLGEFIQTARDLGLNGASLSNWDWLGESKNQDLWAVLERMRWESTSARPRRSRSAQQPTATEPSAPTNLSDNPIPIPTFERRFIQIIRNDEVDKVEDRLDFERYAKTFVQLVLDERTRPPLTIGISGAWGSGKSFLLHRIEKGLEQASTIPHPKRRWYQIHTTEDQRRVHVVRFNAWDYNASEAIWPGLVRGILDKLEASTNSAQRSLVRVRRNLKRDIGSVRGKLWPWLILLISTLLAVIIMTQGNPALLLASVSVLGVGGSYAIFKMVVDLPVAQWIESLFTRTRSYGSAIGYMEEIRSDFKELKKQLPADTKVVVIIDDLDRCKADKIVDTLEAVKLLLNFDIFIVFLAVDSNVIARAVETRYKEILAEAGRSGYLFLDKIIQIPFRIPESDPATMDHYLFSLLAAADKSSHGALPADKAKRLHELLAPLTRSDSRLQALIAVLPNEPQSADTIFKDIRSRLPKEDKDSEQVGGVSEATMIWVVLARLWPVTAFLMHETLRAQLATLDDAKRTQSALLELADIVEAKAINDISTQRFREVADGQSDMFRKAIEQAPAFSFNDLTLLLSGWKNPYAVTIGFTTAEFETFQNLSPYLIRNPRHIKRLVNTYSLIRMLAAHAPNGAVVLNAPEAMLKWLILSSQWPLTAQAMLQAFDDERETMRSGEPLGSDDNALERLHEKALAQIGSNPNLLKERSRLDGDPGVLARLVGDSSRVLTSQQLDVLRSYSINFNPAEASVPQAITAPAFRAGNANGEDHGVRES